MKFLALFQFLARILTSKYLKILINTSLCEMEGCEKPAFQLHKYEKI